MTEVAAKKTSGLFKFLAIFLLLFFVAGFLYVYNQNVLGVKKELKQTYAAKPSTEPQKIVMLPAPMPPASPPPIFVTPPEQTAIIQNQNKALALYVAAKDLKDSAQNPTEFAKNIEFIKLLAADQPDVLAKLAMLQLYAGKQIATPEGIKADLARLRDAIDARKGSGFFENIEKSISRMVRISKLEGAVASTDYNSIIKRTQIALDSKNYALALAEINKLGADGKDVAQKIETMTSVAEVTNAVLDMARAKLVM
jgi:hypothetical protein